MKIHSKKINKKLFIVFSALLFSASHSTIYVFGGINGTTPFCKPKFSIQRPKDSQLAKSFDDMIRNGVSDQEIQAIAYHITKDVCDETFGDVFGRLMTYIVFPFLFLIPEDAQDASLSIELGAIKLFPVSEHIELGGLLSLGYDFGSFSGYSKGFYGYDAPDLSKRKVPEYVKFSNGFCIKAGLTAKINAFIISFGLRVLDQKISIDNRKLNNNIINVIEKVNTVHLSVAENELKNTQKLILGWFLNVMYLFNISEQVKIYIKAGIGGDFDSIKSDTINRTMQVMRNGTHVATIEPFKINVDNKRNFDTTLGAGISYEI